MSDIDPPECLPEGGSRQLTDDLRTRIAAVVAERYRNDPTNDVDGWAANLADAVIRELETDYVLVPKSHTLARNAAFKYGEHYGI